MPRLKAKKKLDVLHGHQKEHKLLQGMLMEALLFGMPYLENQYVNRYNIVDVLKAFDNEITRLDYIEDR